MLDSLFSPTTVAVVGASAKPQKRGNAFLRFFLNSGFGGELYPISPRYQEVLGLKCYPALADVPGSVDYVVCCLPAQSVLPLVEECGRKGTRLLHIYSAGFSETAIALGKYLRYDGEA
ncbi:MAG: CoA-binding protein [Deltaproteobacteria bacterium]|nr:CoA-binding protein [Deltaproteobacteria bacterium]